MNVENNTAAKPRSPHQETSNTPRKFAEKRRQKSCKEGEEPDGPNKPVGAPSATRHAPPEDPCAMGGAGWGRGWDCRLEALSSPSKPHPRRPLAGADPTEPEAHLHPGRFGGEETTHRVPGGPHVPRAGVAWGDGVAGQP